ncbi:MAG: class A beta-lactamase-related serine hydrolase [Rhodobacteraceae bacterium]|nr:class A beta-lactamase-related serine hydrolase [Paracoccaceae bacterium]
MRVWFYMSDLLKVCADNLVNQGVFSGVLWRVDQNSTPMFCGRSGTRDVSTGAFIPENPVFRVYSMTKPIVSVLALKLVETGFLRLNTPLAELDQRFSKMRVLGADGHLAPADGLITIEHLLTHRAGFSYDFTVGCPVAPYYRAVDIMGDGARDLSDLAGVIAQQPLVFNPGHSWLYSVSTDVLAHAIECAGPRSISALPVLQKMPHDLSVQADLGASHPLSDPNFRRGGYGLYSTVSDYMAFANMLLTGRGPNGDIILSSAMMDMARAVRVSFAQNTFRINDEPFSGYGWGLLGRVMENIGQAQYPTSHGEFGWSGAAATYFWVDPKRQVTGCVMTQYIGSEHPLGNMMHTAAMRMLG